MCRIIFYVSHLLDKGNKLFSIWIIHSVHSYKYMPHICLPGENHSWDNQMDEFLISFFGILFLHVYNLWCEILIDFCHKSFLLYYLLISKLIQTQLNA